MTLTGEFFIGGQRRGSGERFHAYDPAAGATIDDIGFFSATADDIADACAAAHDAAIPYADAPLERRAAFLEAIAANIEALGDALLERACRESGLATGAHHRRARAHLRPAAAVCRRSARWPVAEAAHRPRRPRPHPAQARIAVAHGRAWPGRGVRCVQLPARVFDRWRRHRIGAGSRLPRGRARATRRIPAPPS